MYLGIACRFSQIHQDGKLQREGQRDQRVALDRIELPTNIRMLDDRHRRLIGTTALPAFMCIAIGDLGGGGCRAGALPRRQQTHPLDHDEELRETAALLADQHAFRVVEAHDAGGRAMQAELFLDTLDGDLVARAVLAHGGNKEKAEAARARCGARRAGEQQMADAVGQVVIAEGYPAFLAGDLPALAIRLCAGANAADIGTGIGFGNADRGAPLARCKARHPFLAHGLGAELAQHEGGRARRAAHHDEGRTSAVEQHLDRRLHRHRQALPVRILRQIGGDPAGLGIGVPRLLVAGRTDDASVHQPRTDTIGIGVERRDGLLRLHGSLTEDHVEKIIIDTMAGLDERRPCRRRPQHHRREFSLARIGQHEMFSIITIQLRFFRLSRILAQVILGRHGRIVRKPTRLLFAIQ